MKLDKIDQKILHELCLNARESHKNIARKVKTSKSTVSYRIKRFEEEGIIRNYKTIINHDHTGTIYARCIQSLTNITKKKYDEIISSLSSLEGISWLTSNQGMADLAFISKCSSIAEFAKIMEEVQKKVGQYVQSQELSFGHKIYHCAQNKFFSDQRIAPVVSGYGFLTQTVSAFEKELLDHLSEDSCISLVDLAKMMNCSTQKILFHKKKLEKNGTILRYTINISPTAMGLERFHVYWYLTDYTPSVLSNFREYLLEAEETVYVTEALGRTSYECDIYVKNHRSLHEFVERVKEEFPRLVGHFEYVFARKVIKA